MDPLGALLPALLILVVLILVIRNRRHKHGLVQDLDAPIIEAASTGVQAGQLPAPAGLDSAAIEVHTGPLDDSVGAGWYPDPDGKPCARYWDGDAWTEKTRPLGTAPPGSGPSVPSDDSLMATSQPFGYRSADNTFHGQLKQLMPLAVRAVQTLGWTVTNASETASMLMFETKMSMGSWSGVTCSLTFHEMAPGIWRVTGTGKQNVRGSQTFAIDMGEATSKAMQVIEKMQTLAPQIA